MVDLTWEEVVEKNFPIPNITNYEDFYGHNAKMQAAYVNCGTRFFMGRVSTPQELEERGKRALSLELI
jgi:hypothetical protein